MKKQHHPLNVFTCLAMCVPIEEMYDLDNLRERLEHRVAYSIVCHPLDG